MPKHNRYERAPKEVKELGDAILAKFESHAPLVETKAKIDYVFAWPEEDENGAPVGDAIKKGGFKAYGVARAVPAKERAMGRADAEIMLDGEWWEDKETTDEMREALLDHELHHLKVRTDTEDAYLTDDRGRPKIGMRNHDVEVGWFRIIAERHGQHSLERRQAASLLENNGQYFWPEIAKIVELPSAKRKAVAA